MYALPAMAGAKPVGTFELLVADPGDQVDPAIDGQFVVYAGPGPSGDLDVFLRDIFGATKTIAGGPGVQDSPDVFLSTAIYRTEGGIVIESWPSASILRPAQGSDGAVSNPVVHSAVAAWEQRNGPTGMDIVVSRYLSHAEYVLRAPGDTDPTGDQHSPAAFDDLVAYVDDARGGSVWLHDSARGPSNSTRICDGVASGVSIGNDGTRYVIAVARSSGGPNGEDIEVYDRDGALLAALPGAGPQRNPHLSGEWVAFDDLSSVFSQVAVWRWKTPPGDSNLVFVPHPSLTEQRLNDLSLVLGEEVRVVFEDTGSPATGRDIALYRLPINPLVLDGQPNGWPIAPVPSPPRPVDCSSPDAKVLAALEVIREKGKPDERSTALDVVPPPGQDVLPVLVCIHAEHVSSAWVLLDDDAVARPDDFEPHVVDLSRPAEVKQGRATLSVRLEGKPGSQLTVRVLADPGREVVCRDDGDDDGGDGHQGRDHGHRRCGGGGAGPDPAASAPAAPPATDRSGGCGSAGGLASLLSLAVLFARRRLRV